MTQQFDQCECGAWRPVTESDGRTVWASGCAACDKIRRLRQLLKNIGYGDVMIDKIIAGDLSLCEAEESLSSQLDKAKAEIQRLKWLARNAMGQLRISDDDRKKLLNGDHNEIR